MVDFYFTTGVRAIWRKNRDCLLMPVVPTHPPTGAWLIGLGGCRGKAPDINLRGGGGKN